MQKENLIKRINYAKQDLFDGLEKLFNEFENSEILPERYRLNQI